MKRLLIFSLLVFFIPNEKPAIADPQFDIPQSVVGQGGAEIGSTNYGVRGTVGQSAVGAASSSSFGIKGGYWYYPDTTVTGIPDNGTDIPKTFSLDQNYPNPFNPTTTIRFSLPIPSRVTLRIYNVSGEHVKTLADEHMPAGVHRKVWDARSVTSGVYFCRIEASGFVNTRKLVLLK